MPRLHGWIRAARWRLQSNSPGAANGTCNRVPNGCIQHCMSEDQALVQDVLARARGAFERLVSRHQRLVWHMVYRMVQHHADTEELSQEVFLRVYRKLSQFRFDCALSTWIGRIAFTVASRHLQRRRIALLEPSGDEDEDSPLERVGDDFVLEDACADAELMGHVGEAMKALPPIQRTLVTMYHLDELGIGEIARITELPEGTVKNYLYRARLRLRQALHSKLGVLA